MSIGFAEADAAADFDRERRRQSLASLASRLIRRPEDALAMVPFDDVVGDLGRVAEHDLGLQSIDLASIVGTVDRRAGEFDRLFRPRTRRLQRRWQSIAAARRRGMAMPPIDVYRVGELHFVLDGHHRVSVARAQGDTTIEAHVRQVQTRTAASCRSIRLNYRRAHPERGRRVGTLVKPARRTLPGRRGSGTPPC